MTNERRRGSEEFIEVSMELLLVFVIQVWNFVLSENEEDAIRSGILSFNSPLPIRSDTIMGGWASKESI